MTPFFGIDQGSNSGITAKDKLHFIERELRQRYRVYARMVAEGTMSERKRNREVAITEEIAADLRAAAEKDGRT
jgi:hypothetical protein